MVLPPSCVVICDLAQKRVSEVGSSQVSAFERRILKPPMLSSHSHHLKSNVIHAAAHLLDGLSLFLKIGPIYCSLSTITANAGLATSGRNAR
jgi:hypothetical protein